MQSPGERLLILVTDLGEFEDKHIKKARTKSEWIQHIFPFCNTKRIMFSINQNIKERSLYVAHLIRSYSPGNSQWFPIALSVEINFSCCLNSNHSLWPTQTWLQLIFQFLSELLSSVCSLWHQSTTLCTCYLFPLTALPHFPTMPVTTR